MGVKYMQHWEELANARDDGLAEGRTEGRVEEIITLITKKLKKNKSVETIADELEQDVDYVRYICDIAAKFAPEYTCEKILAEIMEEKS